MYPFVKAISWDDRGFFVTVEEKGGFYEVNIKM
jgi:hypothetical protein